MTFLFLSKLKESTSNIERFADSTRGHSNKINLETGRNSLAAEDNEIDNKQQPETGNTKESKFEGCSFDFSRIITRKG